MIGHLDGDADEDGRPITIHPFSNYPAILGHNLLCCFCQK